MRVMALTLALCAAAAFAAPARADTVVTLTFDDGQASQFPVKDLLAARGMRGTFFVNSAQVGTSDYYMTWSQIDALAADGNEIGGHTLNHVDLMDLSLSDAEKRRQVCEDRQNLVARGYAPVDFAYPGGWADALGESIVRDCGYSSARRVGGVVSPGWCPSCGDPHAESLPPEDPFMVRTPAFGSGEITLSAVQNAVTQAELGGGWLPLVFHGVCDSACGGGWVRPSTLAALLDWLAARAPQGTTVRTMREALQLSPPPAVVDTTIESKPAALTSSRSASFALSSNASGATFECSLDGAAFVACTTPVTYSALADGPHTFQARARNGSGVVDSSPAGWTWAVDGTAPDTSITGGPTGTVTSTSAAFSFAGTEPGSFECRLDAGAWGACTSPKSYSGIATGSHSFAVRAKDAAGNVDSTPAERTWTVEAQTPDPASSTVVSLTFDDGRATQYAVKDLLASRGMRATFYVNSDDVGTSDFYMTWSQIDALAADGNEIGGHTLNHVDLLDLSVSDAEKRRQVCEDRQNLVARGYNPVNFAYPGGWADALGESIVRDCGYSGARRVGGIVSPSWCPSCGSPQAESLPPEDTFLVRTPSFGNGEITLSAMQNVITQGELEGGWVPLVFHGVCDSACGEGWVRPGTLAALMDWLAARAAHGTVVRTMRQALQPSAPPPPSPPDTAILSGPSGTVTSSAASFQFSSDRAGATFECKLDAGAWALCTSPKSYSGLANGSHTFSVRAKDSAGNVDATPATRSWTVEVSAPDTAIASGPSGSVRSTSASFTFTATKAGSTFECKLDAGAWGACSSPKSYSRLTNGSHTFSVRAKDNTGVDATPATRTWTADTIAPNTSITSGPSGTVGVTVATFTFIATEAGASFECRLDGSAWSVCTSPKSYSGIGAGSHTFSVRAKDAAGNVDSSPATRSWKRSKTLSATTASRARSCAPRRQSSRSHSSSKGSRRSGRRARKRCRGSGRAKPGARAGRGSSRASRP
jgi:peptidoglycan/xylan/chitin deacetylase (PgdA/CDA1 family)